MKQINATNRRTGAILAFALVPLSGLATDLYLPSFPEMVHVFGATPEQIQQTLAIFLISYGIGQIFAGSISDSFGRYRPTMLALLLFALSNLLIVSSRNIQVLYITRALQGICAAFIVMGKRTYFVDVYSGEQQKSYTAMLTIVWATAPITAPFLGGFLQQHFGWTSCFYFLCLYALILLLLEWRYSGETLQERSPFRIQSIAGVYRKIIGTYDFSVGVVTLGVSYGLVMSFNMSIPFIVERNLDLSPVVTGYCALFSGIALFCGGLIGRMLKTDRLFKKLLVLSLIQCGLILLMLAFSGYLNSLFILMAFVMSIHLTGGVFYNLFFTHCLTRFPKHAGTAGGITSGGSYIVVSFAITGLLTLLNITNQQMLGISYLILSALIISLLLSFKKAIRKGMQETLPARSAVQQPVVALTGQNTRCQPKGTRKPCSETC